jgi:two-component system, NarL family, nitrate/nitrite response regulator NarL
MPVHVLIFEENHLARSFLLRVVRESFSDDLVFHEAATLEAAQALLGVSDGLAGAPAFDFRLILCDLEQSDAGGLSLLARIKNHPAVKIATTLHSDDEHLFPALQCGASGYLLKEDRFEVLVEELQKILRGHPPLSPAMARCVLGFFRDASPTGGRPDAEVDRPYLPPAPAPAPSDAAPPSRQPDATEREVLTWLSKGYTLKEIARKMGIRWAAVSSHIGTVYRKLAALSTLPPQGDAPGH